jgi:hypothetical protein
MKAACGTYQSAPLSARAGPALLPAAADAKEVGAIVEVIEGGDCRVDSFRSLGAATRVADAGAGGEEEAERAAGSAVGGRGCNVTGLSWYRLAVDGVWNFVFERL